MKKEYIYAGISIFLWSTMATVTKLLLGSLSSIQVMLVSSLFAFVFLLILCVANGSLREMKHYRIKDYVNISVTGLLGTFVYHLFLYWGIDMLSASQALIINYLWTMMTVVFACVILKEKMTAQKVVAIVVSFIGVIIVTSNGNLKSIGARSMTGTLYCIIGAVFYGLFSVLNKQTNYDRYVSMMLFYLVLTVTSLIYVAFFEGGFGITVMQTLGRMWIGVATNAIAFTTWALALKKVIRQKYQIWHI